MEENKDIKQFTKEDILQALLRMNEELQIPAHPTTHSAKN